MGKSGASQDPEQYEPRRPTEESEQKNPFSQLGETDDPSTTIEAAQDAPVEVKSEEKAEELKEGAKDFADQATGTVEDTANKTGDKAKDFSQETQDSAGQAEETVKDTASKTGEKAGELGQEAQDWAGKAKKTVGDTASKVGRKANELVNEASDSGFGTAGKDKDIKAPVGEKDGGFPEEYGAADDEFVTRTNYLPSEPEVKSYYESAKAFVAGAIDPEETGPGTLVELKNKLADG